MARRAHLDPGKIEVISDEMAEIWRQKSGGEKLEIADRAYRFARELVLAGIRERHPDWSEKQLMRELAARMSHA